MTDGIFDIKSQLTINDVVIRRDDDDVIKCEMTTIRILFLKLYEESTVSRVQVAFFSQRVKTFRIYFPTATSTDLTDRS